MTELVRKTREAGVLTLTFARPEKKNAFTGAMYEALIAGLEEADQDATIGAVLFAGEGGVFSAGNDIADFIAGISAAQTMPAFRFVKALAGCDTPMVAAVEGVAVGVGTTMLFHCDLVYAAPSARFRMPFIDLALVPEAGSSFTVPQRFGAAKAAEFLMLGDGFDPQEAHRLGLLNAIVPAESLLAHAHEQARRLAAKPQAAMRATRRLLRGDRAALLARIDDESRAFATAMQSQEARAAFLGFMNRGAAR